MAPLKVTSLAIALALTSSYAQADFFDEYMIDPDDGHLDASRFISELPMGFILSPTLITEPAVGTGLGLGAIFFHDTDANANKATSDKPILPKSISILGGAATDNGTWFLGGGHISFWQEDTLRYRGFAGYGHMNINFYSVGNVQLERPVELNLTGPGVVQTLNKRIPNSDWFVGVKQIYRSVDIEFANSPFTQQMQLAPSELGIFDEQFSLDNANSGLGLAFEYDSTDNPFNPEAGYHYSGEYLFYREGIGSDSEYESVKLSGLNYWHTSTSGRLGLRLQYEGLNDPKSDTLPVYLYPFIDLRGIPKSRYQGADVLSTELEYSHHLTPRWKALAFVGAGRAANNWSAIDDSPTRTTLGTGFRYLMAKRYGFYMGVDVARGPEETAVYIQAGSTW